MQILTACVSLHITNYMHQQVQCQLTTATIYNIKKSQCKCLQIQNDMYLILRQAPIFDFITL